MKSHLDTTLTHNGQNDDNAVKDVPTIGEIVVSQRKEFQDELASEGHNEYEVYPVQDVSLSLLTDHLFPPSWLPC